MTTFVSSNDFTVRKMFVQDVAMVDMVANLRAPLEADIARKNKEITDLSKRVEIQEVCY